ncbi:hypothetical protein [Mycoplasma sp. P36-A1]|uniref:hypothetical protein n=1 Tax=Mycoplasma sp. P36-A1 TaxID=3252900 RepID=UPI003C2F7846
MKQEKITLYITRYIFIVSIIMLVSSLIILVTLSGDFMSSDDSQSLFILDAFVRILSMIMIVLGVFLLITNKKAKTIAKVLIIVTGLIGTILGAIFGFVSGICGLIGAWMLYVNYK